MPWTWSAWWWVTSRSVSRQPCALAAAMTASPSGASIGGGAAGAGIVDQRAVIVLEAGKLKHMRRHIGSSPSRRRRLDSLSRRRQAMLNARRSRLTTLMTLDVHELSAFYASPLGETSRRLIGRVLRARWDNCARPVADGAGLLRPLSRPLSRRGDAHAGADAGRAGRLALAAGRALGGGAGGRRHAAAAGRLHRPRAGRACAGDGRASERGARRGLAGAGAGGPGDHRRAVAARRLGAGRRHAVRPRPAVLARAIARPRARRLVLGGVLGRGALCAAVPPPRVRQLGPGDRAGRRGGRPAVRRRAYRRGDQAGLPPGRRAPAARNAADPARTGARADRQPRALEAIGAARGYVRSKPPIIREGSRHVRTSAGPAAPRPERVEPEKPVHRLEGPRSHRDRRRGGQGRRPPAEGARPRLRHSASPRR